MEKKSYFISDAHLGSTAYTNNRNRELKLVRWLDHIEDTASDIYLLGDIFDFWYEYKYVVPKGYSRLFGKISSLTDKGINIHFFVGNHDCWTYGYLEEELGMKVYKKSLIKEINGKTFLMAHGDGLGSQPRSVKIMRKIFLSEFVRRTYNFFIHPRFNIAFGLKWSKESRNSHDEKTNSFLGEKNESLVIYAKERLKQEDINFFVFGHRHLLLDLMLNKESRVIILGDWIEQFSYGVFDEEGFRLELFESE